MILLATSTLTDTEFHRRLADPYVLNLFLDERFRVFGLSRQQILRVTERMAMDDTSDVDAVLKERPSDKPLGTF